MKHTQGPADKLGFNRVRGIKTSDDSCRLVDRSYIAFGEGYLMAIDDQRDVIYKDEVYAVIGAAFEVYNTLGPGFLEAVYQEALAIEFKNRQIPFQEQTPVDIEYKDEPLKTKYYADFLCYSEVLVEIKALEDLVSSNEAQLLHYMKGTKLPVGVLINFGNANKLEWKRFVL